MNAPADPRTGRVVRVLSRVDDAPAPRDGVELLVADSAWTPDPAARRDLRPIRPLALAVLRERDPLDESMVLLDSWASAAAIAERLDADGASWWYRRRLVLWRGLHERLVWLWILQRLASEGPIARLELPSDMPALRDAADMAAATTGWTVVAQAIAPREPVPPRRGPGLRRLLAAVMRRLRLPPVRTGPEANRRRVIAARSSAIEQRFEALCREQGRLLVLTAPAAHQTLGEPGSSRTGDPFLGPIVEALRATRLDPVVVELGSDLADAATWARLSSPGAERLVPAGVLLRGLADAADEGEAEAQRRVVAARLEEPLAPLDVDGVDVSPWVVAELRQYAAAGLAADLRQVRRILRLVDRLQPAALLLVNEYSLPEWLGAAAAAGLPVIAVQHGIIHPHHAGYILPSRDGLPLADRTYVFGPYEARLLTQASVYRPSEVVVGGAPRLDLAGAPASGDVRAAVRAELGVAPGERMVVFSSTSSATMRSTTFAAALDLLLDAPWPGVHLVVKLHPAEAEDRYWPRLVEGIARARGFEAPPLTVVKHVDLFTLLRAADAHLGVSSTVLTDAVAAGTRNMLVSGLRGTDLIGYAEAGVATPVGCAADLLAALDREEEPGPAAQARAAFLPDHFAPGPSAPRIASDLLAGVARPPRAAPSAAAEDDVTLRPATAADADILLAWANDPVVRAAGFHPDPIAPAEHRAWLAAQLASPEAHLFIGEAGNRAVGTIRLHPAGAGALEVSISIATAERGRGTGRRLLQAALAAGRAMADPPQRFVARVRPDNEASLALFRGAGFAGDQITSVNGIPCLVLELAA